MRLAGRRNGEVDTAACVKRREVDDDGRDMELVAVAKQVVLGAVWATAQGRRREVDGAGDRGGMVKSRQRRTTS